MDQGSNDEQESQFEGVNNVQIVYPNCIYLGHPLNEEGVGNGDLFYEEDKSFAGECVNGKAKNGTLSHQGKTKDHKSFVLTCEIKDFLPYNGEKMNEAGEVEEYRNGKKVKFSSSFLRSLGFLTTTGAAFAAAATLSTIPPPSSEGSLANSNLTTEQAPTVHDDYQAEGLTPEEIVKKYGDLTHPCTPEEELKIQAAQAWLKENIQEVDVLSDRIWSLPENAWKKDLILSQTFFPDQYQFNIAEVYNSSPTTGFVCPGISEDYLGLSDFDEEQRIAVYEGSFQHPCVTVNTVLHETLHRNSKWIHPYATEFTQADWIYYAGDLAEELCRNKN